MARYIDADAYEERLADKNIFFPSLYRNELRDMPTADVAPKSEVDRLEKEKEKLTINMNAYRLAAKRLAEEKRENVVEFPCKVGTTLYFLYNSPYADKPDLTPRIYKTTDWYFEVDKTGIVVCTSDIHSFNKKYDYFLGETVFFTKEEAEKAIAELKKKYTEGEG